MAILVKLTISLLILFIFCCTSARSLGLFEERRNYIKTYFDRLLQEMEDWKTDNATAKKSFPVNNVNDIIYDCGMHNYELERHDYVREKYNKMWWDLDANHVKSVDKLITCDRKNIYRRLLEGEFSNGRTYFFGEISKRDKIIKNKTSELIEADETINDLRKQVMSLNSTLQAQEGKKICDF